MAKLLRVPPPRTREKRGTFLGRGCPLPLRLFRESDDGRSGFFRLEFM